MTDFGHRSQKDPEFAGSYREQMAKFDERILTDESFAAKYGDLGLVYGSRVAYQSW